MDYRQQRYGRYNNRRNMGSYRNASDDSCGCGELGSELREEVKKDVCNEDLADKCLDRMPLAMAYVPFQKWRKVFDAPTGLAHGTIFEELVLPFYGYKDGCGMRGDRS
ncbi:spore coat associated protein CotJA [Anaerocolumna sp.]|uniref:spore coat associated protein CotJA n=1 Tax=Anaerocolumna sp. TaxID=2041569 RepID=UPI0028B236A2|nr:spore coat associated protein CotJA [Anaerocolumna sp.]